MKILFLFEGQQVTGAGAERYQTPETSRKHMYTCTCYMYMYLYTCSMVSYMYRIFCLGLEEIKKLF